MFVCRLVDEWHAGVIRMPSLVRSICWSIGILMSSVCPTVDPVFVCVFRPSSDLNSAQSQLPVISWCLWRNDSRFGFQMDCFSVISNYNGIQFLFMEIYKGGSVAVGHWPSGFKGAGFEIWRSLAQILYPTYCYLDLFSVVPSSTPRPRCVNSQLVSLPPVGIYSY